MLVRQQLEGDTVAWSLAVLVRQQLEGDTVAWSLCASETTTGR